MLNLERVNTPESVQEDLADALGIVSGLDPPPDLRQSVFNLAAQALMQRVAQQQPSAVMPAAMAIPGRRH